MTGAGVPIETLPPPRHKPGMAAAALAADRIASALEALAAVDATTLEEMPPQFAARCATDLQVLGVLVARLRLAVRR